MTSLNRRDFLRALGLSGSASALAACGLDNNQYITPIESVLPYVVKPDQVTPGTYTFFATTVTSGPSARSVTARHRDGRVTFVSHNPKAPGRPAVGTAPLLELQKHYSPDRISGARKGGEPVAWDAGVAALAEAMKAASAAGKRIAYLGGYRSGAIVGLLRAVCGDNAVFWEPLGYEAEALASQALFGARRLPYYGLDKAGYILSFGAPFLAGWGDANLEERWATARDPNADHRVARFALVAPLRDHTGATADDWYAAAPGTEAGVARAIALKVAQRTGRSDIAAIVGAVDAAEAAAAAGLSEGDLDAMAANLVDSDGVALPGGATGSVDLAVATYLINLALGSEARFNLGGYGGPIHTTDEVAALLDAADAGEIGVLLIDDLIDPVHALPPSLNAAARLAKADLVVSLSSHPSATQKVAGLVLPTAGALEDWGDENPLDGLFYLRQPAMTARLDVRSMGDILLAAAKAAGLAPQQNDPDGRDVFAAASWAAFLKDHWQQSLWRGNTDDSAWDGALIDGVWGAAHAVAPALVASGYPWATSAAVAGELVLLAGAHTLRGDGRYANQPWAQEVSDPLTGNAWSSWVELSEATAARLGVERFDIVTVKTAAGAVDVPVEPRKGLRDDVAYLAFGQGHTDTGRYADGYGANAATLFEAVQGGAWVPVAATVSPTGAKAPMITTMRSYSQTDEGRAFGVHVAADKLAKVGDAPSDHPGELTGIHHLELDPRLTAKGETYTAFYNPPDHPTYRFGMTVDVNACNGCNACVVACYAENNLAIVGPERLASGKHMAWLRVNRYWEEAGSKDDVKFVPMMCQHCGHAGCENVCPVLATYHNIDGLNAMVYNRCVGTRYCSNACPFSVRRFNYHTYSWPEPFQLMLNPDVSTRTMGVMEKCTFCVQRLRQTKSAWKDAEGLTAVVPDSQWQNTPACVEACPTRALTFGNRNDADARVSKLAQSGRTYEPLYELNVRSAVNYLAKANFHDDPSAHHGGGHGGGNHADAHGDDHGGDHAAGAAHDEGHGTAHGADHATEEHGKASPAEHGAH